MTDTAFDPVEILRERIVALETEIADIRAWFAQHHQSYAGLAPAAEGANDGNNSGSSASVAGS